MILYTDDGWKYEGMSEQIVIALRTELGRSTVFVDQETYDAYVAAHRGN